jgi:S-adenosylmethionine-diacylglycerol 3-amino-3-carboxypropyl transferase
MSRYFQGLNYGLANEDTWIEYNLCPERPKSIFTVCGSGSRVLPLMAKNPDEIHVVDLSETQLALFRLRLAAVKKLTYEEFLFFLGYVKDAKPIKRTDLFSILELNDEDRNLWRSQQSLWENQGFIYLGKWERHFMNMGKIFQKLTLTDTRPLFEAKDLAHQKKILPKYWHRRLFKIYTQIIMNEWVANKLLYKGHYAGSADNKTMNVSASEFVYREVNDLFQNTWVRGNYFLNMIFLNEVSTPDSYPAECDRKIFESVKIGKTKVYCHQQNLLELMLKQGHDFYSLSDTFSYMKDEDVKDFLTKIPSGLDPHPQIVIRTFMRKPSFTISGPWVTDEKRNEKLAQQDCTRMYEMCVISKN